MNIGCNGEQDRQEARAVRADAEAAAAAATTARPRRNTAAKTSLFKLAHTSTNAHVGTPSPGRLLVSVTLTLGRTRGRSIPPP